MYYTSDTNSILHQQKKRRRKNPCPHHNVTNFSSKVMIYISQIRLPGTNRLIAKNIPRAKYSVIRCLNVAQWKRTLFSLIGYWYHLCNHTPYPNNDWFLSPCRKFRVLYFRVLQKKKNGYRICMELLCAALNTGRWHHGSSLLEGIPVLCTHILDSRVKKEKSKTKISLGSFNGKTSETCHPVLEWRWDDASSCCSVSMFCQTWNVWFNDNNIPKIFHIS